MHMNSKQNEAKAYIFLNGDFEKPLRGWPEKPTESDLVIAADGGGRHALSLDWPIHCLIGDLDSIDPETLKAITGAGAEISRFPSEKDEIDFELALNLARQRGYVNIEVLGALGGRWDMTFGNIFLPGAMGWGHDAIRFRHGAWSFIVLKGPARLSVPGKPGDLLSLLPLGEDVRNASLTGCCFALSGETLKAGLSRGLSNEMSAETAELNFTEGTLLVIHRS